ncbi:uncharacterized protein BO97DRAFT_461742 [Aspergillus homomorphus CBS 101889]|uniref:Tat pathway signal sequence n=1 Tax=Aspergillus homomorphus (strain CBS 101889) TaxID=1450537 RepID=A0A395HKH5_ASPHC|nr:hypothetical protein BO97DRAFT_461742 [Aspergillus homomorphus CBS 101889]RAL08250.1 hypothetical protein BO97DRAFT_461742 [Aspergillus homomorphus CBS 101889]
MPGKYERLDGLNSDDEVEDRPFTPDELSLLRRVKSCGTVFLIILLSLSLALNIWALFLQTQPRPDGEKESLCSALEQQRSPYTGLAFDTPIEYALSTNYTSDNESLADGAWDSLSLDSMVIAPTITWAQEKGLPDSWPFPWDANRRIYFVKVYHQLHCLKNIRRAFKQLLSHDANAIPFSHVEHCLDTLRQDLMCRADDTPMPSLRLVNGAGEGQIRQCKDFEKLVAWTKHPDRDACYRRLSDSRPPLRSIDRYAFCGAQSQHFEAMNRYFEVFGFPEVADEG